MGRNTHANFLQITGLSRRAAPRKRLILDLPQRARMRAARQGEKHEPIPT